METRRFGRTGHMSTVAILGAAAFSQVTQDEADVAMEQVIAAGVNHINFVQYANPTYRRNAQELLRQCGIRDVGTMIIKSIARGPWGERTKTHSTWYQPFIDPERIQQGIDFVLSQDVTGLCTVGDTRLLPLVLRACERFTPLGEADQETLIASAAEYEPLFA